MRARSPAHVDQRVDRRVTANVMSPKLLGVDILPEVARALPSPSMVSVLMAMIFAAAERLGGVFDDLLVRGARRAAGGNRQGREQASGS